MKMADVPQIAVGGAGAAVPLCLALVHAAWYLPGGPLRWKINFMALMANAGLAVTLLVFVDGNLDRLLTWVFSLRALSVGVGALGMSDYLHTGAIETNARLFLVPSLGSILAFVADYGTEHINSFVVYAALGGYVLGSALLALFTLLMRGRYALVPAAFSATWLPVLIIGATFCADLLAGLALGLREWTPPWALVLVLAVSIALGSGTLAVATWFNNAEHVHSVPYIYTWYVGKARGRGAWDHYWRRQHAHAVSTTANRL